MWRVIDTDNFGGDYPDERVFIDDVPTQELAERIASAINERFVGTHSHRFYKAVDKDYVLKSGFEP